MTTHEAIDILQNTSFFGSDMDDIDTAIAMAIKALEQQPCEDTVIRKIDEFEVKEKTAEVWIVKGKLQIRCLGVIHNIPLSPVTPKEKTAAWVPIDEEPHEDYECCACGYVLYTNTSIEPEREYKYCPNCGARMVSE